MFETYSEYVPDVPSEDIKTTDFIYIPSNVEREIEFPREKAMMNLAERNRRRTYAEIFPMPRHNKNDA